MDKIYFGFLIYLITYTQISPVVAFTVKSTGSVIENTEDQIQNRRAKRGVVVGALLAAGLSTLAGVAVHQINKVFEPKPQEQQAQTVTQPTYQQPQVVYVQPQPNYYPQQQQNYYPQQQQNYYQQQQQNYYQQQQQLQNYYQQQQQQQNYYQQQQQNYYQQQQQRATYYPEPEYEDDYDETYDSYYDQQQPQQQQQYYPEYEDQQPAISDVIYY